VYLPLLDETGYIPRERFSHAPEIFEHAQRIGKHFDLYGSAVFHTWITDMRWDQNTARWVASTNRGDVFRAQYVVAGSGPATRPRMPRIPGIDNFEGHTFHTARWDYEYTGGDSEGILGGLSDKRVAIIGTGASAIQVIPRVAVSALHTYVFQRTPSSIGFRWNDPTDTEWAESLPPGWQHALHREYDEVVAGAVPTSDTLRHDGHFELVRNLRHLISVLPDDLTPEDQAEVARLANYMTMKRIRDRVDAVVTNKRHAEILKPWYNFGCKRHTYSDEYLPAFNRPNVTLIDVSETQGVERITRQGVVGGGEEYEVDCIIFASGFELTTSFERRVAFDAVGRDGVSLIDYWRDGMRTFHGIMSHGFPNFFVVGGQFTQTLSPSYNTPIDGQARHVVHIISALRKRGASWFEPTDAAEQAWLEDQMKGGTNRIAKLIGRAPDDCTPGYYNQEGRPFAERRDTRGEGFQRGPAEYWEHLEAWRADGKLEGLDVHA
jgi:cyclohexanone monooxygenase